MKALITGASNGLGKDFAKKLADMGYNLILVARSEDKLDHLQNELKNKVEVETVVMDLSIKKNVYKLYEKYKGQVDLLINNAGFGACGLFTQTDLDNELNMIDLNVVTCHLLTKLFLHDFVREDKGQILNVASSAAFQPGPLMATYYATKSYVYNLTMAIYEELRREKSNVKISVLCPGPVATGFNDRAKVKFGVKSLTSDYVTSYTLKKLKRNKLLIIPGFKMKLAIFFGRFVPRKMLLKIIYNIQEKKTK
ncbi:MAG: SDR family oxidoreductase [Bacilli bacterium]|nr:SDR family oxidoreductase [Bacilli bacterium]